MAVLDKKKLWWIVGSFLSAALVTGLLTRDSNYSGQRPLPVGVRSGEGLREQLRARARTGQCHKEGDVRLLQEL